MSVIGPQKIILINSGKHDYANISIDKATHLVGANNAGKTSIISPLQWLFINNEKSMSFPKSLKKTKEYYFKDQYSYILFECQTLDGFKVVGVRGTSRLPGEHERYIYDGVFSKQDYFNEDGSTKNGDEVKAQLSDRSYTPLSAGLLKSALTGIGLDKATARGLNLGLLPIKNTTGYENFRKIYHNLLDLSNVGQHELKAALLNLCGGKFRSKGSLNLEASYNERYVQVQNKKNKLDLLKRAQPHIENCFAHHEARLISRSDMVVGITRIEKCFVEFQEENNDKIQKLADQIEVSGNSNEELIAQSEQKKEKLTTLTEDIGGLKSKLNTFEELQNKFVGYVPTLEAPIVDSLKKTIQELQLKIGLTELEPLKVIQERIERNKHSLSVLQKRVKNIDNSIATSLRKHFSDTEISAFFALYNHQLLDLEEVEGEFTISNAQSVMNRIKAVLQNITNNVYKDPDISINIIKLQPNLPEHIDVKILENQIMSLTQEIKKDTDTLKSAEEKDKLITQLEQQEKEYISKERRYNDYVKLQEDSKKVPGLAQELKKAEKQSSALQGEKKALKQEIQKLINVQSSALKQIAGCKQKETELIEAIRNLPRPKSDWKAIDNNSLIEDSLSLLIENHKAFADEETQLSNKYENDYILVQKLTDSSYIGSTEQETLNNLKDEIENIERQEEAVKSLWGSLMTALGTNLNYLLSDIDVLKNKVEEINRDLGKIQISDLHGVKLHISPNLKLTNIIASVAKQSAIAETTLFSSLQIDETSDAIAQLQKRLQSRGKIEIGDLFSLHFHVVKPDGKKEEYNELKDVESEGTTITIKVLVNLIFLKGLFEGKQKTAIPFYLDEVGRLDEQNAKAVVQQAEELGFTPIIASPDPMDVVSNIYALRSGRGGLYVDDRNLMILSSKEKIEHA